MSERVLRNALGLAAMIALAVMFSTTEARADEGDSGGPGAIAGVVVTADGAPVDGARVLLFTRRTHRLVARTQADENGHFGFRHVRPGRYVVVAAKRDVGRGRAPVDVHPDEISRVRVVIGM